jgi:PKD repeat protein
LFAPGFQFDSTVYLVNFTEPVSNATSYEWNFGDGSANSFELNALHTFPAFDSNYVVCLTASNKCSSFMYCDTVWVDSLHLGGSLKTSPKPAFFESNSTTLNDRLALINKPVASSQQLVALSNYPNPFNSSTIIDYQIWQSFNQAELRITNVLGQTVFTQKLNKPIDKINIDGSLLANGIYYYTLIIDGNNIKTKSMSVVK